MAIKADFSNCAIHVPNCWGVNCDILKCKSGHHPQAIVFPSAGLMAMSAKDVTDLLEKRGYYDTKVEIDPQDWKVRITSKRAIDLSTQEVVNASMPVGVRVSFMTLEDTKMKIPTSLMQWYQLTKPYVK